MTKVQINETSNIETVTVGSLIAWNANGDQWAHAEYRVL